MASCSKSTIVAVKISMKYNKYKVVHHDKLKKCFELDQWIVVEQTKLQFGGILVVEDELSMEGYP